MKQPLAYVHPEAQVADNVVIEPFVTIDKNVVIEEGTRIGSNVTILEGAHIGKNCKIFPGAVIAAVPQDLKFRGEKTIVKIGDNTTIRECVTVNRGTAAKGVTEIGDNCLIMAYAHIAHDCKIGNNCIITNACQLAGEVVVDDFAILGGMTAVHQFVHIGKHVMIQGGSLIGKDVPPYVIMAGNPVEYHGVNAVVLQQHKNIYRILYQSGLNNSDAIERIEAEMPASRERDEIIMFVRNSKRGIMKGYMG